MTRVNRLLFFVAAGIYLCTASSAGISAESDAGPQAAKYGSWRSPVSAELTTVGAVRIGQVYADDGGLYWHESRPEDNGRGVIVKRSHATGSRVDVTPEDFNIRTRIHEYGGAPFTVLDGAVYASNFKDQRLYRFAEGKEPTALTPPNYRYGDCVALERQFRLICVREDHTPDGEPENALVSIDGDVGGAGDILFSDADFVASPRISPDGQMLAWVSWDHPNMPWDGTRLWIARLQADGSIAHRQTIAGGPSESVVQPTWSPNNRLYFASDRSNWWNIYEYQSEGIRRITRRDAEFAVPLWTLGNSNFQFESAGELLVSYIDRGVSQLARVAVDSGEISPIPTGLSFIRQIRSHGNRSYFIGASETRTAALFGLRGQSTELIRTGQDSLLGDEFISRPQAIEFRTSGGNTAHAFYYAPRNPNFRPVKGESPPLLVTLHGGPTAMADPAFHLATQFWTTRGFAVVDVNYGGSSGFGRAYRDRLRSQWGVADIQDAVAAVGYLVSEGLADKDRVIIRGGSAGGYSVLAALAFTDHFSLGVNYYGIGDLELIVRDTHKFESRYVDSLVGSLPKDIDRFRARSPIYHLSGIDEPLIVFQGLDDKVVPPNQSEMIVEAVKAKGVPVAYLAFAGEQHGFRRKESIVRSLEAELYFIGRAFDFEPADKLPPVEIFNDFAWQ